VTAATGFAELMRGALERRDAAMADAREVRVADLTRRPCGCRTDVTVFGHESYCHQARICAAAVTAGKEQDR
jgi:hypothetical protein